MKIVRKKSTILEERIVIVKFNKIKKLNKRDIKNNYRIFHLN